MIESIGHGGSWTNTACLVRRIRKAVNGFVNWVAPTSFRIDWLASLLGMNTVSKAQSIELTSTLIYKQNGKTNQVEPAPRTLLALDLTIDSTNEY